MRVLALILLLAIAIPQSAHAMSTDVKHVMVSAGYGAAAGTVLGLVSYPFTGSFKGVLMGTSVGLVLGIVVGLFHISNRDNPENPLRSQIQEMPLHTPMYNLTTAPLLSEMSPRAELGFQIFTF